MPPPICPPEWSNCPAGNYNRAKGKEGYPSIVFQCIIDYNHRILAVYGPQFGTRNDKEIVKLDPNVKKICFGWFSKIWWHYYIEVGWVSREKGMYLICDNGYLWWPQLFLSLHGRWALPHRSGVFSSNIESVQKDVDCTFGISKKRWRILNNGFQFRDIGDCNKIFITCCCLHNYLLDIMEWNDVHVGWGRPFDGDGIWLDRHTDLPSDRSDRLLLFKFSQWCTILAKHLYVSQDKRH